MTETERALQIEVATIALRMAAITYRQAELFEVIARGGEISREAVSEIAKEAETLMEQGTALAMKAVPNG